VIGVLCSPAEVRAAEEFFELFKTPWEFAAPGRRYDLVISTLREAPENLNTGCLVIYQSSPTSWDDRLAVAAETPERFGWIEWDGAAIPIYGNLTVLRASATALVRCRLTSQPVACFVNGSVPAVRIGYDLFQEVAFLLTEGQPPQNARVPTLDLHISLLRAIMAALGLSFVEVPPVPAGYEFMACLTHDVDFVGIRDHKFDHTMWGFLYRSLIGSLVQARRGERSWSRCLRNWAAAWSLPLVHLGLREDFWLEFDRYAEIERGLGSTFFFIPFKDVAGTRDGTPAPQRRAAKYDFVAIRRQVLDLARNGCEIGLHGIDAWQSAESAGAELRRIREVTGEVEIGTRMHWLYWNEASPERLEEAGLSYDSTCGYNDAIGFRAGTAQAFRPLNAKRLLELPLHIQDSALFYRDRMRLSENEALESCRGVLQSMSSCGGALMVNWHTRSLSPERLWGDFYLALLAEIRAYRVWFATPREVAGWYRKRRALRFAAVDGGSYGVCPAPGADATPPDLSFTVRIHHATSRSEGATDRLRKPVHTDYQWNGQDVWPTAAGRLAKPLACA
jgi:hypothetical protein